ncbi:DUF4914 family protein [bacterium]|nr:DUF4914 family protein [bacterium]
MKSRSWKRYNPPKELEAILEANPDVTVIGSTQELLERSCGDLNSKTFEVSYQVPGLSKIIDATVVRVRNGIAANYPSAYMRRRDPDAMLIGDDGPTDHLRFEEVYHKPFGDLRQKTFDWLSENPLVIYGYVTGKKGIGQDALVVAPANAAFFGFGMALLQGITAYEDIGKDFKPASVIYVAPTFRYTDLNGKQVVVHYRQPGMHEVFSYCLYPGPSAKKAAYSILLNQGEQEGWVTAHCSTVRVVTPYDNEVTFMHEGASGAGKSEMLEYPHREDDGRMLYGVNLVTGEQRLHEQPRTCSLHPVTDDMALCHPSLQHNGKLAVTDAEDAWFVRTNHIRHYGTDLNLERLTAEPEEPLLFLNINAAPDGIAMIWDHIMDAPGKPCPNPRVVIPREIMPNVVNEPVDVDIRSFGFRTPPCTADNPTYGIVGFFHILPPALAWLWRLVAPRGFDNPSIVDTKGLSTEGVGSYWAFATGKRTVHANYLLEQFTGCPHTSYVLTPNQHVGAWKVGFMPQWLMREYLARRGHARFEPENLREARCPLLGEYPHQIQIEGRLLSRWFFAVDTQPEVGEAAYDKGAEMLFNFFHRILQQYDTEELTPLGREIIQCCLDRGSLADYKALIAFPEEE